MVAESLALTLQQQRRYQGDEVPSTQMMSSEPRSPPSQALLNVHAMDERTSAAVLYGAAAAAAAAAAAGNNNSPLSVGIDLTGFANLGCNVPGMMNHQNNLASQRKQREFIPDNKKDDSYWDRRRRNNEAAKRSREKRRLNDMVLEQRVLELTKENHILRAQLTAIAEKYGITGENLISIEQVLATLPAPDQLLNVSRTRSRIIPGIGSLGSNMSAVSPVSSSQSMSPTHSSHVPAVQQRQSVLMSLNRPRSPSPSAHLHYVDNGSRNSYRYATADPIASAQNHYRDGNDGHGLDHLHSNSDKPRRPSVVENPRSLPPLPPLTPVPATSPNSAGACSPPLKKRRSADAERNVPFYDLCSSSSSNPGSNSGDEGSRSPVDTAVSCRLLPHKLRHKTHLGERDAAAALLTLNEIKQEPELDMENDVTECEPESEENGRSTGSSDERDSGVSSADWALTRSSSVSSRAGETVAKVNRSSHRNGNSAVFATHDDTDTNDSENEELRSRLARLVTEVETLKTMLSRSVHLNMNKHSS